MANKRFEEKGAQVLSASTDSQFSQKAFATSLGGIAHPILGDYHPKGAVAAAYGVYNEDAGMARRAVIIIDGEGVIRHKEIFSSGLPQVDAVLAEVDKL